MSKEDKTKLDGLASAISDMLTKTEANSTYATKIEAKDVLVSAEAPAGQEVL